MGESQCYVPRSTRLPPRVTKHLHDELERREKGDRLEAAQARLAIAQKLKEGKLQDLGKMISEHQKKHPSRRVFQTNTMGERPIGPRLESDTRTSLPFVGGGCLY